MLRRCLTWLTGGTGARELTQKNLTQREEAAAELVRADSATLSQEADAGAKSEAEGNQRSDFLNNVFPANPKQGRVMGSLHVQLRPHVHTLACDRRERICTAVGKVRELETLEIVGQYSGTVEKFSWIRGSATRIDNSFEEIEGANTSTEYVLQGTDVGYYIGAVLTVKENNKMVRYYASEVLGPVEACSPRVVDLRIDGAMVVGETVRAEGVFVGGREGPSEYWWLRVRDGQREMISEPSPVKDEQDHVDPRRYKLTAEDEGCVLKVKCRPCNQAGETGQLITSKPSAVVQARRSN